MGSLSMENCAVDDRQEPQPPAALGACHHVDAARLEALHGSVHARQFTLNYATSFQMTSDGRIAARADGYSRTQHPLKASRGQPPQRGAADASAVGEDASPAGRATAVGSICQ